MSRSKQGTINGTRILLMAGLFIVIATLFFLLVFPTGCVASDSTDGTQEVLTSSEAEDDSASNGFVAEASSTVTVEIDDTDAGEEG